MSEYYYASKSDRMSEAELRHRNMSRQIAAETIVLLENKNTLPLAADERKLALYGGGARNTVKGGSGSGEVASRDNISLEQAFLDAGFELTSQSWMDQNDAVIAAVKETYMCEMRKKAEDRGTDINNLMLESHFARPDDLPVEESQAGQPDIVVYVISRSAGEGSDRRLERGDYYLSSNELSNIRLLAGRAGVYETALKSPYGEGNKICPSEMEVMGMEHILRIDTFNRVQEEIKRRAERFKSPEGAEMKTYPFTGLVQCGRCGKNYVRSGAPAYRTWTCGTRRKEGLKNCDADIIPEEELFRLTAEVLGGEVTEDAVRDKITAIRAGENRTLVFCLRNGKEIVKQWKEHETAHVCTGEQKRQISLKNSGRKRTEEQHRQQSERMKEYWKGREYPEERRKKQSEKMRKYWNDGEASDAHRQTVSRLMNEMRAGENGSGKEGQDG